MDKNTKKRLFISNFVRVGVWCVINTNIMRVIRRDVGTGQPKSYSWILETWYVGVYFKYNGV